MIGQHLKLFASLNRHGVEYLLIGGALAIAYGVPRVTKDVDLFLNPDLDNAKKCLVALKEVGLGTADLTTAEEICQTEVTILKDVVRLDLLTQVKGLTFGDSWRKKVLLELEGVRIPALCLEHLIQSKKAAARSGDLEDIKILEMARRKK